MVSTSAGAFLAARVARVLTMAGKVSFTYQSRDYVGVFTFVEKETLWTAPNVGVVKIVESLVEKGSAAGVGGGKAATSLTLSLTDYLV
jgi:hypothetical protein